jgi:putative colanic acid biosynthesis acetyltransferase WcaF
MTVRLASFKKNHKIANRNLIQQVVWLLAGLPIVGIRWLPGAAWRVGLLRLFGAKIGSGVRIKTGVRIKYPWRLRVGNDCWIGEDCWIDNMADVVMGNDVCLSQGCYLCTGNHDWKDPSFSMFASPIVLEDGCWVASRSVLGPGVVIGENGIAAIGSVVWQSIPAGEIHGGNPATFRGLRIIEDSRMSADASLHPGGAVQVMSEPEVK